MWLGKKRGNLIDWCTQKLTQAMGRRVALADNPWLTGPVGSTRGIGLDYFLQWAAGNGLQVQRPQTGAGLIPSFAALAGHSFDPMAIDPLVTEFYEHTADFDIDIWSEWSGLFRPLGFLVAAIFCRRLSQFNLPLSAMESSWGMTSEFLWVADPITQQLRVNAWVRALVKTGRVIYVGAYSVTRLPGADGPCVKAVYPLPNGNAIVIFRPRAEPDGSLLLNSTGKRFGDPGFYLTVHSPDGRVWARYLRSFEQQIRVFRCPGDVIRTDHRMSIWGLQYFQWHYRMRPRMKRDP